ncbi:DUF4393 domain-containing protein [Qipengyuania sp. 1NDH17]|uniref:DUF4393 domain-containing protein n=1 Tax=Qipengyuania polymorpha TaxID=2867234 RepID=A0ABS7IV23_9SPHN|nr:DUF4393 domain-containing protein [Qipengyuania polymorpha]MBX7457292.1 DUF4393 domain-containing protein [Qipengyuania polymorpha]
MTGNGGDLIPIALEGAKATGAPLGAAIGTTLSNVWQGVLGDRVAAWRIKNAMSYNEPIHRLAEERGLTINLDRIPESFAFSWFDKATQEDSPEIQELFAQLLANAAGGNEDAMAKRNVELVGRLSPSDANLLQAIYEEYASKYGDHQNGQCWLADWEGFSKNTAREDLSIESISYENMQNLGVLEVERVTSLHASKLERWLRGQTGQDGGGFHTHYPVEDAILLSDEVYLTETGMSLLNALF